MTSHKLHSRGLTFVCLAALTVGAIPPAESQQQPPARQEIGNLVLEGVPPLDPGLAPRLRRYLESREASFLDWLPDGSMLVSTRFGDVSQVHRVAAPLGMREQLTFHSEPVLLARAPKAAAADGFVFMRDAGGDENAQIYYQRLSDREERLLTDGRSLHGNPVWSSDGKRLAFYGNGRDGVTYDVYVVDVAAGTPPRLVVAGLESGSWYPLDWSPDDRKLLLWRFLTFDESYLYVADVATGALTPVPQIVARREARERGKPRPSGMVRSVYSPSAIQPRRNSGPRVGVRSARFSPDGRGVYVLSDEGGEFARLSYIDLVTGESRRLSGDVPWDVEAFDVSPDGRYLAYIVNEDGLSRLTVIDNVGGLRLQPAGLPDGQIANLRFDGSGRRLAMSVESAQSPRDVYVYELDRNALVRWTRSEPGPVDLRTFVPAELVHYPTWDRVGGTQRRLSAYIYRPRKPGPHPVLIFVHGGPESQYRPGFEPFFQFLVNELGYAVVAPNVRGSSGYGKSFLALDDGRLRDDAVRDIGSLLAWLGFQKDFDRERIAIMGVSYGGYMTLASLAAYGDRLRGGINVVGIANFVTFLEGTSPYRQDFRRVEYGDERDPRTRAFLTRISPINNVQAIRRPLLVVQGLNDPRVPAAESEQLVARVRANGGEVWYLAAKDEGHTFRKKPNRDFYLQTAAAFLERLARPAERSAGTSVRR